MIFSAEFSLCQLHCVTVYCGVMKCLLSDLFILHLWKGPFKQRLLCLGVFTKSKIQAYILISYCFGTFFFFYSACLRIVVLIVQFIIGFIMSHRSLCEILFFTVSLFFQQHLCVIYHSKVFWCRLNKTFVYPSVCLSVRPLEYRALYPGNF